MEDLERKDEDDSLGWGGAQESERRRGEGEEGDSLCLNRKDHRRKKNDRVRWPSRSADLQEERTRRRRRRRRKTANEEEVERSRERSSLQHLADTPTRQKSAGKGLREGQKAPAKEDERDVERRDCNAARTGGAPSSSPSYRTSSRVRETKPSTREPKAGERDTSGRWGRLGCGSEGGGGGGGGATCKEIGDYICEILNHPDTPGFRSNLSRLLRECSSGLHESSFIQQVRRGVYTLTPQAIASAALHASPLRVFRRSFFRTIPGLALGGGDDSKGPRTLAVLVKLKELAKAREGGSTTGLTDDLSRNQIPTSSQSPARKGREQEEEGMDTFHGEGDRSGLVPSRRSSRTIRVDSVCRAASPSTPQQACLSSSSFNQGEKKGRRKGAGAGYLSVYKRMRCPGRALCYLPGGYAYAQSQEGREAEALAVVHALQRLSKKSPSADTARLGAERRGQSGPGREKGGLSRSREQGHSTISEPCSGLRKTARAGRPTEGAQRGWTGKDRSTVAERISGKRREVLRPRDVSSSPRRPLSTQQNGEKGSPRKKRRENNVKEETPQKLKKRKVKAKKAEGEGTAFTREDGQRENEEEEEDRKNHQSLLRREDKRRELFSSPPGDASTGDERSVKAIGRKRKKNGLLKALKRRSPGRGREPSDPLRGEGEEDNHSLLPGEVGELALSFSPCHRSECSLGLRRSAFVEGKGEC